MMATKKKTPVGESPITPKKEGESPEQLSDGHIIPFYDSDEPLYNQLARQCPKDSVFLTLGLRAADRLAADLGVNGVHSGSVNFGSTSANRDNKRDKRDPEVVLTHKTVLVHVDPLADPDLVFFS
jgi:hypothetical protein